MISTALPKRMRISSRRCGRSTSLTARSLALTIYRGGNLSVYDQEMRASLVALVDEIDVSLLTSIWETALVSTWEAKPVWLHGDVTESNLLVKDRRLSAVIDFGTCGVGDPSCDLAIAWTLFDGHARKVFRARLGLDTATWERARLVPVEGAHCVRRTPR